MKLYNIFEDITKRLSDYVIKILERRWPEAEEIISTDLKMVYSYIKA